MIYICYTTVVAAFVIGSCYLFTTGHPVAGSFMLIGAMGVTMRKS